ncbi:MAG: RNA polymerase sigma-32 factor [Lentimonas sp.]|jgi:RNA polymerase sigma-32 factor
MSKDSSLVTLPKVRDAQASFFNYLQEIQKFPLLTFEEEQKYANDFKNTGNKESARMLIQSHLRLVVKIASSFKNYGLPIVDLVSEGNVGLMQAVRKFEPEKGFRFSTYAMWWIKAYIQEYILHSWSLVKIGTTAAQKKLFFNLNKIKKRLGASDKGNLLPQEIDRIANDLNVSKKEVINMNARMQNSDGSLNKIIGDDGDGIEVGDKIASEFPSQEEIAIANQEKNRQQELLKEALLILNEREKDIVLKRKLSENPSTLEDLSKVYQVSKERIRQIEEAALKKIGKFVKSQI